MFLLYHIYFGFAIGLCEHALIILHQDRFQNAMSQIYGEANTNIFKDVLLKLRSEYSLSSHNFGKYTVRTVSYTHLRAHETKQRIS